MKNQSIFIFFFVTTSISLIGMDPLLIKKATLKDKYNREQLLQSQIQEIQGRLDQIKRIRTNGAAFTTWIEENPNNDPADFDKELTQEERSLMKKKYELQKSREQELHIIENMEKDLDNPQKDSRSLSD